MARTLTAANTVIMLSIDGLYPVPQQLQGFSADNVTNTENIASAETSMGVDGRLSAGFVFTPTVQNITLQADSLSCDIFERWRAAEQRVRELYVATGVIIFPATGRKYSLTRGFLTGYTPTPNAARTLQARPFQITWERVSPAVA